MKDKDFFLSSGPTLNKSFTNQCIIQVNINATKG